jgi:hypothetical protein
MVINIGDFNGDLMVVSWVSLGIDSLMVVYPQVNVYKNCGKSPFLMGKSTISMAIFNSKLANC